MAQTTARLLGSVAVVLLVSVCLIGAVNAKDDARVVPGCTVASSTDTIVGMTQFMGNKNTSDSIWHDELPYFRQHGPISKFTLYRAFFYDGLWHDPGELKGMQFWYGPKQQPPIYTYYDGDSNLFGARKPHLPQEFALDDGELITRVELQWDPISMRYAVFNTNKGRTLSWGFKDVIGATKAVAEAPVPGAYVAAIRGFEGKPAPVSKKRYIIQVSIVWAVPSCKPAGSSPGGSIPLESSRLASSKNAQGPTNVYMWDKETVDLIPQGIEGANIVYAGVTITKPVEGVPVPTIPVASLPSASQVGVPVPTLPGQSAQSVQAEKGPVEKPATQQAAAKQVVAEQTKGGALQKESYVHEHRDPAVARKAVNQQPQPQQQQVPAKKPLPAQGTVIVTRRSQVQAPAAAGAKDSTAVPAQGTVTVTTKAQAPAAAAGVKDSKAAAKLLAEHQTAAQPAQPQQQEQGRWAKTWSSLLG